MMNDNYDDVIHHTAHMLVAQLATRSYRSTVYGATVALHSAFNVRFATVMSDLEAQIKHIQDQLGTKPFPGGSL